MASLVFICDSAIIPFAADIAHQRDWKSRLESGVTGVW
jgi:hypothetical protein